MLAACGIAARKHWKVIGRNVRPSVGGSERGACNDMWSGAEHVHSPFFTPKGCREEDISVSVHHHCSREEDGTGPDSLHWITHTHTHSCAIATSSLIKSPLLQMRRCWQLAGSRARCGCMKKGLPHSAEGSREGFNSPAVKQDSSEKLLHVCKRDNKEAL